MKHEEKTCPRCHTLFECKVGSINECQCQQVILTEEERAYMNQFDEDCFCAACMKEMKRDFHFNIFTSKLKKLLRI